MASITSPRPESPAIPRITSPSTPSASGTPTSSVRPSFDIPRSDTASPALPQHGTPVPNPAQRRNRAALRDYYNLKARNAAAGAGAGADYDLSRKTSIVSNASDSTITSYPAANADSSSLTTQLDEPSFDAEAYVSELLKTASLRDILKTESALVSEIRNLDGERKALVYDNYSKLIKAVGTIAEMQKGMHKREPDRLSVLGIRKDPEPGLDGVEKLGEKLDGLLETVKQLGPQQTEDTKIFVEAREKRRQKETVKWALDAPSRLRGMLARGDRDGAEQEYQSALQLLDQWKGVTGVSGLRVRCEQIMKQSENPDQHADEHEEESET
ncbi:Vps51/Vps67-domain-containing protein [Exophiala viscosa]|uniref:Vps51/Vps67-domain-containing protein n=1 Tax=Exophiala viscosa TaxID=2486360 RepID=UPI0021A043B4|nr:Vps51/Vps67-domain-containing protein [Exophiala viscosa]